MAIATAMLKQRNQSEAFIHDSQRLRTAFKSNPFPLTQPTTQPAECAPFHPPALDDALKDLSVNFATGAVPVAGESSPTTTVMFSVLSAPRDKLVKAGFDYTDDLLARCAHFDVSYQDPGSTPYKTMLLKPPSVGEKAYAMMSPSGDSMRPFGDVGLRVLAGTISISMSLSVAALVTEADAQPALNSMSDIAQQLLHQATQNPATVSPPPANARTPEQLADLLQGITGPDGSKVDLASGTVIVALPGPTPTPAPSRCTFSDRVYFSELAGSSTAQGEMTGPTKTDFLMVRAISMPTSASPPYPFDTRAAALRDCPSMVEEVYPGPGSIGNPLQWTGIHRLDLTLRADSAYAIAHEHPDGGVWHLLVGARRGSLTVELDVIKNTEADLQPGTDAMAAIISQVFARAGL